VTDPLLSISDLSLTFPKRYGTTEILRQLDLELYPGESLGVVGESGSGKSLLGLTILGLEPRSATVGGSIVFRGENVRMLTTKQKRALRGSEIAMIYQDALVSLNPGMRVRKQLRQAIGSHGSRTPEELLQLVQLGDTARFLHSYPHQLSGGQRQRVLIAMAIARDPAVIIADEPTTALDVTVQAEIMKLLARLRDELQFALVLISHDLGLVARVCERVAVMYAGDLVELGPTLAVLAGPSHPYTAGLIEASRSLEEGRARLAQIPGAVPAPSSFSTACRFVERCNQAQERCSATRPGAHVSLHGGFNLCHFPFDGPSDPDRDDGCSSATPLAEETPGP